jgi:hypothetical protein
MTDTGLVDVEMDMLIDYQLGCENRPYPKHDRYRHLRISMVSVIAWVAVVLPMSQTEHGQPVETGAEAPVYMNHWQLPLLGISTTDDAADQPHASQQHRVALGLQHRRHISLHCHAADVNLVRTK